MSTTYRSSAFSRPSINTRSSISSARYTTPTASSRYSSSSSALTAAAATSSTTAHTIREKLKRTDSNGEVSFREYKLGGLLGKGGFAKVYELTDMNGAAFAAKVIDKKSLVKPKTKQKLLSEIKIHKSLNHKNIVRFEHFFDDEDNVYILLEVCHCKSMMELMKTRQRLNEAETKFLMYQILEAVEFMHSKWVIHRDLKLGNLFLTEDMQVKIGDFGLAAQLDYEGERKRTICGTPNYIAPEIIMNQGHSYEVDVWSIGVILYTMLVGTPPFETTNVKETYSKIKANSYSFPPNMYVGESAKNLIKRILNPNPAMRPTIQEILSDKFFMDGLSRPISCPQSLRDYSIANSTAPRKPKTFATDQQPVTPGRTAFKEIQNTIPEKPSAKKSYTKPIHPYPKPPSKTTRPSSTPSSANRRLTVDTKTTEQQLPRVYSSPDTLTAKVQTPLTKPTVTRKSDSPTEDDEGNLTSMHDNLTQSIMNTQKQQPFTTVQATSPALSVNSPYNPIDVDAMVDDDEVEEEDEVISDPDVWVTQWSDFSSKYGLAYKLNVGYIGAHFNDSTKLIWRDTAGMMDYMERKKSATGSYDEKQIYFETSYPEAMNKKITLIKYFKTYLDSQLKNHKEVAKGSGDGGACTYTGNQGPSAAKESDVYVKRWLRTRHAIIFRLSNKTVQVCFFDNTEIILSSEARLVTYTDHTGQRNTYSLKTIMRDPQPDLAKRLKYTKDILYQLINRQTDRK